MTRSRHTRPGQSLVIFALFAVVLFLFVGVGIDSGLLYVERRHLQNITDAACLAAATDLVMGKTETEASATANTYITNNLNSNAALLLDLPNLTRTIQVTSPDVRVTLAGPAFTTFMRVASINTYNVMARSHCDATSGGGVMPIAVVRFPGYDKSGNRRIGGADTSKTLPQNYGGGKKPQYITVRDVLQRGDGLLNKTTNANQTPASMAGCGTPDSQQRNWYDWNGGPNNDPVNHTGIYHDACTAASPGNTSPPMGPEVVMAGNGAFPNMGTQSFLGPVVLDARNIGTTPQFYNDLIGAGTSLSAWKDSVFKYIYSQYPGPDIAVGDQLGIITGVSAGPLVEAISTRFKVGDVVTTIVYDGNVHFKGDFQMSIVCKQDTSTDPNPNCNNTGTNQGKYIYRKAPPTTGFFDGSCKYSGEYYLATNGNPVSNTNLKNGPGFQFHPAKYLVAVQTGIAQTVRLTGRISDSSGSGADFGGVRVRWTVGTSSPTAWQTPDVPVDVTLAANASVNVKLEVIQTATTTKTCNSVSYTVPDHVYGTQTVQVIGRSTSQSAQHSVYGALGMYSNTDPNCDNSVPSTCYTTGDYFFSFANDPIAILQGAGTFDGQLQFIDANSDPDNQTELTCNTVAGGTLNCSSGSATITGLGSGMSASIEAGQGGAPLLNVTLDGSTPVGFYSIDVRWNSSPAHSTRFLVYVAESTNPSVNSYITVLCYGRFKITHLDSNDMRGRAVSGCIDPRTAPGNLLSTSRMRPW